MPRVVFVHRVNDVDLWASKHDERVAAFAAWGSNLVEHFSPDGDSTVALSADVHDMAAMHEALRSPEIAAAKAAHGVVDPVALYVEKG